MHELILVGLLLAVIGACSGALAILHVLISARPRNSLPEFHSTLERDMYLIDKGYLKAEDMKW